jgi:hypothetical protein
MLLERSVPDGARFAPNGVMSIRRASNGIVLLAVTAALALVPRTVAAQSRVGKDSATRWTRFGRDLAYGAAAGLGYALVDQAFDSPHEWGGGWGGYGKRAASNVGAFVIQEGVTEGLAAAMNRPLDYRPCQCTEKSKRITWALRGAVQDQMPDGKTPIAVPRIVGAYVGAFAQATWRPAGPVTSSRTARALIQGTTSLGLGALINMYYEFRHHPQPSGALTSR